MTTEVAQPRNVIAALATVMAELPGIGKDQHAAREQGGYAYRGIEAITREVQPLFAKYGIVFVPRVLSTDVIDITVNQRPWTDTRLMVEYDVYGPGGPEDKITVGPIYAIGRDNSDKGANKCMTQALKYALLQVLCISDAKDDADKGSPEGDVLGPEEVPTRAGNLRRGPRVLEGWADIAEQRAKHESFESVAAEMPEEVREGVKAYRRDQGYGYPMSRVEYDDVVARMVTLAGEFNEARENERLRGDLSPAEGDQVALAGLGAETPEPDAGADTHVTTAPDLPTSEEAQAILDQARAALEHRGAVERAVADTPLEDVRAQLAAANWPTSGRAPEVRERLVDLLLQPEGTPADLT